MRPKRHETQGVPLLGRVETGIIILVLACSGMAIMWLGHFTDVDLLLADAAFDHTRGTFPLRHAWLPDTFNHGILKALFTGLGAGVIVLVLFDLMRPMQRIDAFTRLRLRIVGLSAGLVPLVIGMLKQASDAHCPWDLARYGGMQPYARLFDTLPFGANAGHCLPAGHASTSLWLVALAVFWLPANPGKAAGVAAAGLAAGFAMGWMQQLRGAHFLTHTLWSVWIAVLMVLVTAVVMDAAARRYTPQTTS